MGTTINHQCFSKEYGFSYINAVCHGSNTSVSQSLSQACTEAGLNDYSAFYRAYSKIMHEAPRKSLTRINF